MTSRWLAFGLVGLLGPLPTAADEPKQGAAQPPPATQKTPPPLAERIAVLRQEHEGLEKKFQAELRAAGRDNEKISKANQEYMQAERHQLDRLKALVKEHGQEPAAFDGILLLAGPFRYGLDEDLLGLVQRHHLANPKLGVLCFDLMYHIRSPAAETLLREVAARNPQRVARGQATFALGRYYRYRAQPWGEKVSEAEQAQYVAASRRQFAAVVKDYAAVPTPDGRARLGARAASELARIRNLPNLQVGKAAPEIAGEDLDGKPMKLSDYRGKVVVLDFWGNW